LSEKQEGAKTEGAKVKGAEKVRIMIVEDHHVVRQGFIALLRTIDDFEIVAEAANGEQAVALFREHQPDVTLMDLRLPGMGGVETIAKIRQTHGEARIIVLTTFDGDEDIYRAIRAGAKAYLLKDVKREELFQCIREVHAGRFFIPPGVAAKLAGRQTGEELTSRELEVLRLLAEGKPNKLIAASLSIAEVTVKSHVRAIFTKLNVLSRTEAIAVATRSGLIRA
jgi:two-component system NarL family response regulator